ncbi:MAG: helix-turn-helix transcriptional regulator [Oscillospiraceae bacterium]
MACEFPRILTLLRKERKISQRQAADSLGISQGLLSHYEKGKRECGLDFIVRAAAYYQVSCDYLLGRSPDPAGKTIAVAELPDSSVRPVPGSDAAIQYHKRLISNSVSVLFSLVEQTDSAVIIKESSAFIMLAVYKLFRKLYVVNPHNSQKFFSVDAASADALADAAMSVAAARLDAAAAGVSLSGKRVGAICAAPEISTNSLATNFPENYAAILNLIKVSEAQIKIMNLTDE